MCVIPGRIFRYLSVSILMLTSLGIWANNPNNPEQLNAEDLIQLAENQANPDSMLLLFRQARKIYKAEDKRKEWLVTINKSVKALQEIRKPHLALAQFDTAFAEIWWEPDRRTGTLYALRGFNLKKYGAHVAAKADYERAFYLMKASGELKCGSDSRIMKSLASLYLYLGEYEKAEMLYFELMNSCRDELPDDKLADIYCDLGITYRNKGDISLAFLAYEEGLGLSNIDLNSKGLLLCNKAELLFNSGEEKEALKAANEALFCFENADQANPVYVMGLYQVLAGISEASGDYNSFQNYTDEALSISKMVWDGQTNREIGKLYRTKGELALSQGNLDEAERMFFEVVKQAKPDISGNYENLSIVPDNVLLSGFEGIATTLWHNYKNCQDSSSLNNAYTYYSAALRVQEALRANYIYESSSLKLLEESLKRHEGAISAAVEISSLPHHSSFLDSTFSLIETSKAIVLLESLRELEIQSRIQIPQNVLNLEMELEGTSAFYRRMIYEENLLGEDADSSQIAYWKSRLVEVSFSRDSLLTALNEQYKDYYQMKKHLPRTSIGEVQQWLTGKNDQLIQYFWGEESLFVMAISKDGPVVHRIDLKESQLEAKVGSLIALLSDYKMIKNEQMIEKSWPDFLKLSHEIYALVLEPVIGTLPRQNNGRLMIVPDGLLGYLPFDVLLASGPAAGADFKSPDYLINHYTIRYAYSAALAMLEPGKKGSPALAMGGYAPRYGENWLSDASENLRINGLKAFGKLEHNQPEVKSIAGLMRGQAFLGDEATEATFRSSAHKFRVLHLSMHGFTNEENPLYSGLVFSQEGAISMVSDPGETRSQGFAYSGENQTGIDATRNDGILHAYEIFGLELQADLTVLSACKTGIGKLIRGEGIMSLARAFRAAGCPNIVMSLWEADDRSTRSIMEVFYQYLHDGKAKDKALRQAKLDYLRNAEGPAAHPAYWSTFVLIGDDQPVEEDHTTFWWIAGFMVILLGTMVYLRFRA